MDARQASSKMQFACCCSSMQPLSQFLILAQPRHQRTPSLSCTLRFCFTKLDFWLRNPDYLADELISRFERDDNAEDLELARDILDSDEPEVRSHQMLRYLFGAYEPLDEALSVLRTPGLVIRRKQGSAGHTTQHDYYLTASGRTAAQTIVDTAPDLSYYVERSVLVADLAAGRRGSALRDIQYLQPEYADAALGTRIVGIADRARQRLKHALASIESEERQ